MIKLLMLFVSGLGLAGVYVWGLATSTPAQLALTAHKLANCERVVKLDESRKAYLRLQLDRNREAVKYSQCRVQIQDWVKNPDKIPKPFNPHEQLKPPGIN